MATKKFILAEKDIPQAWYNVIADMPNKPMSPLNPATKSPLAVKDLYPIFAEELCKQELNTSDAWIEIPEEVRDMYNEIDENYESLYQYFSQINYTLERGNEYFFFSRIEPKATLEQKIMRAYYWIDVLDFFKTYDETFGPGFRFQPEQILVETNINMLLQNKLDGMRKHFSDKDIRKEVLENMIRQLTKDSFLEQENEKTNTYKVMSAWHYLERLIESINIYDETEDEKPE
jgi:hypothetical protein